MIGSFLRFCTGSARVVVRGGPVYYGWVAVLLLVTAVGVVSYGYQFTEGLIVTSMRDQLSWGFYIGNFAFLVGVAAAAVVLVIPAYVYGWGPLKEVVLLGELMAVAAIIMCILFVTVDIGQPLMFWHMLPIVGTPNFPYSMLTWDVLVLTSYLLVNFTVVTHLVFKAYRGEDYNHKLILPIVFLSIPLAIAIHTVTAFLFVALPARPFWHAAVLAPRFITSAFCSGPALMVLVFLVLRKFGTFHITDKALFKIGEMLAYAMALNLFLLGTEVFEQVYFATEHTVHAEFQWFGLDDAHGNGGGIAPYAWFALMCNVLALIVFIAPELRHRIGVLSVGCMLAISGVYVEKGLGLMLPGQTPDAMGEVYNYAPSAIEVLIGLGIWSFGALLFTLMVKVTMEINNGTFRDKVPA